MARQPESAPTLFLWVRARWVICRQDCIRELRPHLATASPP
jgi:hypothetical protein